MTRQHLHTGLFLILFSGVVLACQIMLVEPTVYIIRAGDHEATPVYAPQLSVRPGTLSYAVSFDVSCRYDVGPNQADWNKLFGVGYVSGALQTQHHVDSARWGWRYDPATDRIELCPYCYIDRRRVTDENIIRVRTGQLIRLAIDVDYDRRVYVFRADERVFLVPFQHRWLTGYRLNPYFGGDARAPHTLSITMQKSE